LEFRRVLFRSSYSAATVSKLRERVARSDTGRRTEVVDHAILAARAPCVADAAAVQDQEVGEAPPVGAGNEPDEVALDLHGILLARQAEPLREPTHVRVNDDPLRLPPLRRDHARRLPRHAR